MNAQTYIAFYKPDGVLTAFTSDEGQETLKNYIDVPDVYPAGRLDLDSEGLLLLTNDGTLAHRLTDPAYNHPKTYLVQVEGQPTSAALAKLSSGVEVKGELTRRAQVMVVPEPNVPPRRKPVTPHGPTTWLRVVLTEGKKRQIRHMTAAVGLPTLRLIRIAIGPVAINDLQPGEWRNLTPAEVNAIKDLLKTQRPKRMRSEARAPYEIKADEKPAVSPGKSRVSRYRSGGRRSPGR